MILESTSSTTDEAVPGSWAVERRVDGSVVVRVPSRRDVTNPLPDAVFSFRAGDPQYGFWSDQVARRQD